MHFISSNMWKDKFSTETVLFPHIQRKISINNNSLSARREFERNSKWNWWLFDSIKFCIIEQSNILAHTSRSWIVGELFYVQEVDLIRIISLHTHNLPRVNWKFNWKAKPIRNLHSINWTQIEKEEIIELKLYKTVRCIKWCQAKEFLLLFLYLINR